MDDGLTRRDWLELAGVAVVGTACATSGCALLPRGGAAPSEHRCDHRHCCYFRLVGREGRCALAARVSGGQP